MKTDPPGSGNPRNRGSDDERANGVWIGWPAITAGLVVALGMSVWVGGGMIEKSRLFRAATPEEVRDRVRERGSMSQPMAEAIYRRVGSEDDARAMTAFAMNPSKPEALRSVAQTRRRFIDEAGRQGFDQRRGDDGFWLATETYRPTGDEKALRNIIEQAPAGARPDSTYRGATIEGVGGGGR